MSPQTAHVGTLKPNVIVLGGGDLGGSSGHDGGTLKNGISVLIKQLPESSLASSAK